MNNSTISKTHINYIDIAKGIGILLVILGHSIVWTPHYPLLSCLIYNFHMPFFFILAGMVISDKHSSWRIFSSRFTKFIPLLLLSTILYILFRIDSEIINSSNIKFFLFEHFAIETGDLWFLWALLIATTLTASLRRIPYAGIIILLIAIIAYYLNEACVFNYFYLLEGLICAPFIFIGYYLKSRNFLLFRPSLFLFIVSVVLWCLISFYAGKLLLFAGIFPRGAWNILAALAGSYVFLSLSKVIDNVDNKYTITAIIKKFLIWTGQLSLVILFIHHCENHLILPFIQKQYSVPVELIFISRLAFIFSVLLIYIQIAKYFKQRKA